MLPPPSPPHTCPPATAHGAVITTAAGTPTTVKAFLEGTYGYTSGMAWWSVLILAAFIVLFRVVSTLAVRFLSFQSR